jgi:hypothetical protein
MMDGKEQEIGSCVMSFYFILFLSNHVHSSLSSSQHFSYISDFPDDELWNHPNSAILPHLGASTEEAEDAAAAMAAYHHQQGL